MGAPLRADMQHFQPVQRAGGAPARGRVGRHGGRHVRQVPGFAPTVFPNANRRLAFGSPHRQRTHVIHHQPRFFSVIHSPGGRIGSLSALIVGIALAIFGACILPIDPIAGILIGGFGVFLAASGGLAYRHSHLE